MQSRQSDIVLDT